jgi:protein disulfide-isomerase A1
MSKLQYIALFFLIALSFAVEVAQEDDVYVLTDAAFDEFIKEHPHALVEFYAPWCGHCKKLAPEYAKAAKALKSQGGAVLAKVDSTVEKGLAERFQIKGYPTLKFFINGSPIEYNGGRTETEIINWVNKKTGSSIKELTEAEALDKFLNDHEVSVVFFGSKDSEAFKVVEKVAQSLDDVVFGLVVSEELRNSKSAQENGVVLFKSFDEKRNDFSEALTEANLKAFISKNSLPTLIKFDQKAAQKIFGEGLPCLFLFHGTDEGSNSALEVFAAVAADLKGKILVATSPINDGLGKRLGDYIGVSESELPHIKIVNPNGGEVKKYNFEGEVNPENLVKFYEDWAALRLKPVFKSAPLPEKNDEPVKVVVGKNFKDIVLDNTKDVLLEFYAPWCGHCKNLAPIYEKVATRLGAVNPNIVLAKIDATANEIEGIPIQGFPTLKYFPSNNKTPVDFSGERTEDGLLSYLKSKTTFPWVELEAEVKEEKAAETEGEKKKDDL